MRDKLAECLYTGIGYFRGVSREGSSFKSFVEAVRSYLDYAVPMLYPKLRIGARPLKGTEAEDVLKAANLTALPQVFYGGEGGTDLIIEQNKRYIPNIEAETAREVLGYIQRQHSYGNKVTGKDLEAHLQAMPYGWEYEMVLLILATLLRAGAIEVTHQGRRFRNHQDPQSRVPFSPRNKQAFRAASFAPRQAIELKTLTDAVRRYEELTGHEVDVEETAIASAFKKLAADELAALLPLEARVSANRLPSIEVLAEYKATLQIVADSASDDCVRILAGEGKSLKEAREQVRLLKEATTDVGLRVLEQAKRALEDMWPQVQARPLANPAQGGDEHDLPEEAEALRAALGSSQFYAQTKIIRAATAAIQAAYLTRYEDLHLRRGDVFQALLDEMAALAEWEQLSAEVRARQVALLSKRADADLDLPEGTLVCRTCSATLSQMESDLAAAAGLRAQVMERIRALVAPEIKVEHVRVSEYVSGDLSTEEAIDEAIKKLRDRLIELVRQGVRIVLE